MSSPPRVTSRRAGSWHTMCPPPLTFRGRGRQLLPAFLWLLSFLLCLCAGNAVLLIEPAAAQTEWKDRPVTLAIDDQKNPQIALPADKDYTIIVWEDYRHGDADLYMQTRHKKTPVFPIISASM